MKFALSLCVVALGLSSSWSASGQACCTSTGSGEFGVLSRSERAGLGVQASYERGFGSHGTAGEFRTLEGVSMQDYAAALGGGWRPLSRFQVHGTVAMRGQSRQIDGVGSNEAWNVGDASLGVRADVVDETAVGRGWMTPFMQLGLAVRVPTGSSPTESDDPTGADATGVGAWAVTAVGVASKDVTSSDTLEIRAAFTFEIPRKVETADGGRRDIRRGHEARVVLAYSHRFGLRWSVGSTVDVSASGRAVEDAESVPRSSGYRSRVGFRAAYALAPPNWLLVASMTSDLPISGTGANVPFASATTSLALQWALPN